MKKQKEVNQLNRVGSGARGLLQGRLRMTPAHVAGDAV
jgi:hypothetical protein